MARGHQQSRRTPPCHTDAASLLPATRLGAVKPIIIKRPDQIHQSSRESDLSAAQVSLKSASPRACKCASAQPYLVTHVGLWCANCGCNERSCRRRPWELDDEGCTRSKLSPHRMEPSTLNLIQHHPGFLHRWARCSPAWHRGPDIIRVPCGDPRECIGGSLPADGSPTSNQGEDINGNLSPQRCKTAGESIRDSVKECCYVRCKFQQVQTRYRHGNPAFRSAVERALNSFCRLHMYVCTRHGVAVPMQDCMPASCYARIA